MKVLYDHQTFELQIFGGISRYFTELMSQSSAAGLYDTELSLVYTDNGYLKKMSPGSYAAIPKPLDPYARFMPGVHFKGKRRLFQWTKRWRTEDASIDFQAVNRQHSVRKLQEGDYDVFHATYYNRYFLDHIGQKPFVLTVYDLIHERFPEFLMSDPGNKSRAVLERADMLIAISESTKQDLMQFYQVPEDRIAVTHLACSLDPLAAEAARLTPEPPVRYLLHVGHRDLYKNFYFFLEIVRPFLMSDPGLHVVCTGPAFYGAELEFFRSLGIAGRMVHYYGSDAELAAPSPRAPAPVHPPQVGGFGLPLLEAVACGCPVVCSRAGSFPEVAGDAALYFEPKDPSSIADVLGSVLSDNQPLRASLMAKGYERLKQFSWSRTAAETRAVYEQAIARRRQPILHAPQ